MCKDVRMVRLTCAGRIIAYYAGGDKTLAVFTINGMSFDIKISHLCI